MFKTTKKDSIIIKPYKTIQKVIKIFTQYKGTVGSERETLNEKRMLEYFRICYRCDCRIPYNFEGSIEKDDVDDNGIYELKMKFNSKCDGVSDCEWCKVVFCSRCNDFFLCVISERGSELNDIPERLVGRKTCMMCLIIPWYLRVKNVEEKYVEYYMEDVTDKLQIQNGY